METEEEVGPEPIVPGVARALSPLVRRILALNPSPVTGMGTNTYLVGIDEIVVIDPGPVCDDHLDSVAGCGGDRIRWITTTRSHETHAGGLDAMLKRTGAEYLDPKDGDSILGTEFRLTVFDSPGPSPEHRSFLLEEERLLFCGDLLVDGGSVGFEDGKGDLDAYLKSFETKAFRRLKRIAPTHGHIIEDPKTAVAEAIAHREAREEEILKLLSDGPVSVDDLVAKIYNGIDVELTDLATGTVTTHLAKLASEKKAKAKGKSGAWSLT